MSNWRVREYSKLVDGRESIRCRVPAHCSVLLLLQWARFSRRRHFDLCLFCMWIPCSWGDDPTTVLPYLRFSVRQSSWVRLFRSGQIPFQQFTVYRLLPIFRRLHKSYFLILADFFCFCTPLPINRSQHGHRWRAVEERRLQPFWHATPSALCHM